MFKSSRVALKSWCLQLVGLFIRNIFSFIFYRSSDQYSWYSWWPKYATPEADRWLKWKVVKSIVYIPLKVRGQKFCPGMYADTLVQLALSRADLFAFCCLAHPILYDWLKGQQKNRFFVIKPCFGTIKKLKLRSPNLTGLGIRRILKIFKKSSTIFRFLNHSFLNYKLYECPPFARGLECLRPCSPESLGSV